MKTLKLLLVALVATLSATAFGQKADTIKTLPPLTGIEEAFVIKYYRVNWQKVLQITYVSTQSGTSGFIPIKLDTIQMDSMGKQFADTIRKGLPGIQTATQFWVKQELVLASDGITVTATSQTSTVTVPPKPLVPKLGFLSTPVNDKKVYVNLSIDLNVDGRLDAYTVLNAIDTLTANIPRNKTKPWYITPNTKSYIDSTYTTNVDVWTKYVLTDTVKPSLFAKTKWVFVPAYIAPAKAEIGMNNPIDSTNTIVKITGWCITKNLPVQIKLVFESGDTTYVSLPASNGLSNWSATITNRTPGKTYTIIAYAINMKGVTPSSPLIHTMPMSPPVLTISSLTYYTSGTNLIGKFGFVVPVSKTANAIVDWDEDSLFNSPENWQTFNGLTGSGNRDVTFTEMLPGTYFLRCQLNDGTLVTKITQVKIHTASVVKIERERVIVYPNPAKDWIHSDQPIVLFNSIGKEVGQGTEIFIENLPKGFYYYGALGSNTYSEKIMKE